MLKSLRNSRAVLYYTYINHNIIGPFSKTNNDNNNNNIFIRIIIHDQFYNFQLKTKILQSET